MEMSHKTYTTNTTKEVKLTCLGVVSLTHLKLYFYVDYIQLGAHHTCLKILPYWDHSSNMHKSSLWTFHNQNNMNLLYHKFVTQESLTTKLNNMKAWEWKISPNLLTQPFKYMKEEWWLVHIFHLHSINIIIH
jgi:hypothetical protein